MKRLMLGATAVLLSATLLEAGGRVRGPSMWRPPLEGRGPEDIFDFARRFLDVSDEVQTAITDLDAHYSMDEREARAALRKKLDKEYMAKVLALLPAEQKAKYQAALAAAAARDEAVEAAQKELHEALEAVRKNQGLPLRSSLTRLPWSKTQAAQSFLKLSEDQQREVAELRRGAGDKLRAALRNVRRPRARDDVQGWRTYAEAARKARQKVVDDAANTIAEFLDGKQKADYQALLKAINACRAKVDAAEAAYEQKLVEVLGEEKVRAVRGLAPKPNPGTGAAKGTDF